MQSTWMILSSWALGAFTFSGLLAAWMIKVSMAGLRATTEAATWGSIFRLIQLSTRTMPDWRRMKNDDNQSSNLLMAFFYYVPVDSNSVFLDAKSIKCKGLTMVMVLQETALDRIFSPNTK